MVVEYYCPKCNSTNVHVRKKEHPIIRKPMDQMPIPFTSSITVGILTSPKMEAHCKDCDHTLPLKQGNFYDSFATN